MAHAETKVEHFYITKDPNIQGGEHNNQGHKIFSSFSGDIYSEKWYASRRVDKRISPVETCGDI